MSFDPGQFTEGERYEATITSAKSSEALTGTPQLWLRAETARGPISGVLHITPLTLDRVEKTLNDLGVPTDTLAQQEWWDDPATDLVGVECSIVPEIREYNGTRSWVVKWWNPRRKAATSAAKSKAATMFSRRATTAPGSERVVLDDDVPF